MPACRLISELISADRKTLVHADAAALFDEYQRLHPESILEPDEWLRASRAPRIRKLIRELKVGEWERFLSDGSFESLMSLYQIPVPKSIFANGRPINRFRDLMNELLQTDATWERLGRLLAEGSDNLAQLQSGLVNRGYMNILKGNVLEHLSRSRKIELLVGEYADAAIISGIRVRFPESGSAKLFTDDVIAQLANDGNLVARHAFEIKAGYNGGLRAADQVTTWHNRLEEPLQLLIRQDSAVTFAQRNADGIVTRTLSFGDYLSQIRRQNPHLPMPTLEEGYYVFHHGTGATENVVALRTASRDLIATTGQGGLTEFRRLQLASGGYFVSSLEPHGLSHVALDRIGDAANPTYARRLELGFATEEVDYMCGSLIQHKSAGRYVIGF